MIEKKVNVVEIEISIIQPTQLFLSKSKYDKLAIDENNYDPILVRKTGDITYLIDYHEEVLFLANKGLEKIKVCYYDNTNIDTLLYFTKINLCTNKGIKCIKDLSIYLLNDKEYKRKWEKQVEKITNHLYKTPFEGLSFIREITEARKAEICNNILRDLPNWFNSEDIIVKYSQKVKKLDFIKIEYHNIVIGFLAYQVNYGINCDLYLLGIYEDFHRFGIGSKLIDYLESEIKKQEVKYLSVKTISDIHIDSPYGNTRNFFIKNKFYPFEELTELWDGNKKRLLMVREVD